MRAWRYWFMRRALAALVQAADDALLAYDTELAVQRDDGTYVISEVIHELGPDHCCVNCGQRWPCAMQRLALATTRARQEL